MSNDRPNDFMTTHHKRSVPTHDMVQLAQLSKDDTEPLDLALSQLSVEDLYTQNGLHLFLYAASNNLAKAMQLMFNHSKGSYASTNDLFNMVDKDGNNALILATKHHANSVFEWLIQHKININHQNNDGKTALYYACKHDNARIIQILNKLNATFFPHHENTSTPSILDCVTTAGHYELLSWIIYKSNDQEIKHYGKQALITSIKHGQFEICKFLFSHLQQIGQTDLLTTPLLHLAITHNQNIIARWLLAQHVRINLQDELGNTSLHLCFHNQQWELFYQLLELDADINMQNNDGNTVTHLIAKSGAVKELKAIMAKSANINMTNHSGQTALEVAQNYQNTEIIRFIQNITENESELSSTPIASPKDNTNALSSLSKVLRLNKTDSAEYLLVSGHAPVAEDFDHIIAHGYIESLASLIFFDAHHQCDCDIVALLESWTKLQLFFHMTETIKRVKSMQIDEQRATLYLESFMIRCAEKTPPLNILFSEEELDHMIELIHLSG